MVGNSLFHIIIFLTHFEIVNRRHYQRTQFNIELINFFGYLVNTLRNLAAKAPGACTLVPEATYLEASGVDRGYVS